MSDSTAHNPHAVEGHLPFVAAARHRDGRAALRVQRKPAAIAPRRPVARVLVDVSVPHLDRLFEYTVPAALDDSAVPGCRVSVRFAGRDLDGYLVERVDHADHEGRLMPLRRVVSPEPVLSAALVALCRAVALRYAGTLADVVRLAVPPRRATVEKKALVALPPPPDCPEPGPWTRYPAGPALLRRLAQGEAVRAVWTALPDAGQEDNDWPMALAIAVVSAASSGRGVVVVVPDGRDVTRISTALDRTDTHHVCLTSDLGPTARYAAWLSVRRGEVRIVVGTRAAMFAPVHNLGLVVCWDDGDDVHAELHAPYPHVRDVLMMRAEREGAAALVGSLSRSVEAQAMIDSGWAREVSPVIEVTRRSVPRVVVAGEGMEPERDPAAVSSRLPSVALRTAKHALAQGPVLVQVPRSGYVPVVSCQQCRAAARCPQCHGPLAVTSGHAVPRCQWCDRVVGDWHCLVCGDHRLRSVVVGAQRTAEELGRAFPGVRVYQAGSGLRRDRVPAGPSVVVATPGAEPVADGGYAAALLLDGWSLLERPDLRAGEEALRRWLTAAALVRGADRGGQVVVVADGGATSVEALVRWAPGWYAQRELADRLSLGLPPTRIIIEVRGAAAAVREFIDQLTSQVHSAQPRWDVLGPVPLSPKPSQFTPRRKRADTLAGESAAGDVTGPLVLWENDVTTEPVVADPMLVEVRALIRCLPSDHGDVLTKITAAIAIRAAQRRPGRLMVRVDPRDIG
ncbi:MAG: primosome assembly protein PriA [Actinomycetota bacterium]